MVRSKSEVIIANALAAKGVDYAYERPLTIDGVTKYPDFTIEDMESGSDVLLGALRDAACAELSPAVGGEAGVVPTPRHSCRRRKAAATSGTLIVTRDEANGSIDSAKISKLIAEVLGS